MSLFFCLAIVLSQWLSPSLVQSNLVLYSPGGRGRNLSTMGRVAVSESDHMMKESLLWEALPWGREQWAYGASPSASNFLMEKHKQGNLINTSYSGDSHLRRTSAGSLAFLGGQELLYFDFAIFFPVLILCITNAFWQEEESWTLDWRDRSTPLLSMPLDMVLSQ